VDENDLVIDFFGGSCTTGEAVYEWVASNKKDLNFLLIQAAEQIDASKESYKKGYSHISEVTADRLKLAIQDLKPNFGGFKFYKLWYSNFKQWRNYSGTDIKQLETLFSAHESNLIDDWTPDNLLTEVLLLEGFPLDSIIENVLSFRDMIKLVQESGGQQAIDPIDTTLFAWAQRVAASKYTESAKAEVFAGMLYERNGGRFEMYDVLSED
jgi:hypothetical protein